MIINSIWAWFIVAIVLLIIELIKTNGYTLWLSVSAAIVALLTYNITNFTILYQFIVFIILSLCLCFWWLNSLKKKPVQLNKLKIKEYLGRVYPLEKSIKSGKGQLEIDGLIWFVHSERDLPKGSKIRIKGSNGVVLLIEEYVSSTI